MLDILLRELQSKQIPYREGESMAAHTTLKVGGPACIWVDIRSTGELASVYKAAAECGVPAFVIGNGSNLLVRDGGFAGVMIHMGEQFSQLERRGNVVYAQAGARMSQVAVFAQAAGLSGMEPLAGIPGTIGGALFMNAGAYGTEIGALVISVEVMLPDGIIKIFPAQALSFGYRHSVFMDSPMVILSALLQLQPGKPDAISGQMRDYAMRRREKQPLAMPSAGSFFKRPQGHFAGALIEEAGLKGYSVGGAQVSQVHAGFLVNTGGATAGDFLALVSDIQAKVKAQSGVDLMPEVQIIGCDSSC